MHLNVPMEHARKRSLVHLTPVVLGFVVLGCIDETASTGGPDFDALVEPSFRVATVGHVPTMGAPSRMAATPSGRLLVTDPTKGLVFDVDPATLYPNGAMRVGGKPVAIGMAGNRILVGDAEQGSVDVYNAKGAYQYSLGAGAGAVGYPVDLAIDKGSRSVFVVDAEAKDIKVFDLHGPYQYSISGPGPGASNLQRPTGIVADRRLEQVLVSDHGDPNEYAAIKVFGFDGTFVRQISGRGSCGGLGCSGGFSTPQGLAITDDGAVYFADVMLAQVLAYDRASGQRIKTLGGRNLGPPELRVPFDVVIGKRDDVFVTSYSTARVEAFRAGAALP